MATPATIRLLTVDQQPLVHAGVRHLLRPFDDLQPVGEAFDLADALRLAARHAPDLVLEALVKVYEHDLVPRLVARGTGQRPEHQRHAPAALARRA